MKAEFAIEAEEAAKKISWWQEFRMKVFGNKIYIGHEKRRGWSEAIALYLFWCEKCNKYSKDYYHGFSRLDCNHCAPLYLKRPKGPLMTLVVNNKYSEKTLKISREDVVE